MNLKDYLYYQDDWATIYCGDCLEIIPDIQWDCVLIDPVWGTKTKCNAQRFTRARSPWWRNVDTSKIIAHKDLYGDSKPFDPSPWIDKPAILWGANHYASKLKDTGGWLVWDKRQSVEQLAEKGWPLGEAELAWTNILGSVRVFRNLWSGLLRSSERREFYHPTQKPIALMKWCIGFLPAGIILDSFAGSFTTCVAAKNLNRKSIGIEIIPEYCEIGVKRLRQEVFDFNKK